jgi:hypothetical protein
VPEVAAQGWLAYIGKVSPAEELRPRKLRSAKSGIRQYEQS